MGNFDVFSRLPNRTHEMERYAVLACVPALLVASFNQHIAMGLHRDTVLVIPHEGGAVLDGMDVWTCGRVDVAAAEGEEDLALAASHPLQGMHSVTGQHLHRRIASILSRSLLCISSHLFVIVAIQRSPVNVMQLAKVVAE